MNSLTFTDPSCPDDPPLILLDNWPLRQYEIRSPDFPDIQEPRDLLTWTFKANDSRDFLVEVPYLQVNKMSSGLHVDLFIYAMHSLWLVQNMDGPPLLFFFLSHIKLVSVLGTRGPNGYP